MFVKEQAVSRVPGNRYTTPRLIFRGLALVGFCPVLLILPGFIFKEGVFFKLSSFSIWAIIAVSVAIAIGLLIRLLMYYIAGLKEASLKLRHSEALLKEAEALSHNGSWEWSQEKNAFFWSDEMYRIHGLEPNSEQVDLRFYLTLIHPDDVQYFVTTLADTQNSLAPFTLDYRIIRANGEVRYLALNGKFKTNLAGNVTKVLGNTQDVTDLKNTSILLEKSESIYRTIARNVPDSAVFLFDSKLSLILSSGPALARIDPQGTVLDVHSYLRTVFKDDIFKSEKLVEETFRGNETRFEQQINGKIYKITFTPVYMAGGKVLGIMVVMHDITDIKQVQQDLETKVTELNRSNKDLEQFAYIASHDLQEPLRKIRAFSERLNVKYSSFLPEEGLDYIGRMGSASERMQLLIDDLLTFSRISRPAEELRPVNFGDLVKQVVNDLEFSIDKKQASIDINCNNEVKGVPSLLRQLLQNLLSNSLKFAKKDEPVHITISSDMVQGLGNGLNWNKTYCRIEIRDNGIGFDNQYADKIFTMFHRLHSRNEYEGTGIGLAICKKIVENHNGIIEAEGKENEGALFRIFLPVEDR